MRHYDTSCGPMSCVPTRKDGVPEFVIKALYCRAVVYIAIPFVKLQVWSFTNGITTPLHNNNYRALIMNSGTPSFFVGTQDIGYHNVSFMSQSCLHFLFI